MNEWKAEVLAAPTSISLIEAGKLSYRGIPLEELVLKLSFEGVAFLLIRGKVPAPEELKNFVSEINSKVNLLEEDDVSASEAPISFLISGLNKRRKEFDNPLKIFANLPAMVASWRSKEGRVEWSNSRTIAAEFLFQIRGKEASPEEIRALDQCMLIHADHELNISTFGLRLAASTGADCVSSFIAALGILSGPLHGGASENVHRMLKEISSVGAVKKYLDAIFQKKEKVFGFGHLLYKQGDPRAKELKKIAKILSDVLKKENVFSVAQEIEKEMFERKKLLPNIDFYSACIYELLGFDPALGPGIFAMSRSAGWVAHYEEQVADPTIILARGFSKK